MYRQSLILLLILSCSAGLAQERERVETETSARQAGDEPYRYALPARADTERHLQRLAQAIQLREYCADQSIEDAFVDRQLAAFSRITGREEDCRTLLEY
ncbi:MAG TPA: hypothetical protein VKY38_03190 [Azoarcus sp.]|nr:hypothetical protein [Azoarcus sp.]